MSKGLKNIDVKGLIEPLFGERKEYSSHAFHSINMKNEKHMAELLDLTSNHIASYRYESPSESILVGFYMKNNSLYWYKFKQVENAVEFLKLPTSKEDMIKEMNNIKHIIVQEHNPYYYVRFDNTEKYENELNNIDLEKQKISDIEIEQEVKQENEDDIGIKILKKISRGDLTGAREIIEDTEGEKQKEKEQEQEYDEEFEF